MLVIMIWLDGRSRVIIFYYRKVALEVKGSTVSEIILIVKCTVANT
jgi:hypothetical protein